MAYPRHVFETYIKASPEQIWEGLTRPEFTQKYFFHCAINCGWEPNAKYTYDLPDGTPAVRGEVLDAEPPHRLVMTYQMLFTPELAAEQPSKVTWEITQVGDACRLTCIHGDLAFSPATWTATASGWSVVLQGLKTLLETGEPIGEIPDDGKSPFSSEQPADIEWHRTQGIETNNATFRLLDSATRTYEENELMIHQVHASAFHWGIAGTDINRLRAEYMCSRVYAFVGRAEPALHHANRCLAILETTGTHDFDEAYAHEALARAHACAGNLDEARKHLSTSKSTTIADPEDRAIVEADIKAGPWYGLDG
jgi:uncharacterized protein YndB with AHSA1/START domain